jgi:hypothetical protein
MPSDIEQAEKTITDLEAKLARVKARSTEIATERDAISFAVHTDGDHKARAKLDKLNEEGYRQSGEIASIEAALKTAHQCVADRRAAEARKVDRQKAAELRKHVDQLAEVPAFIDEHLEAALRGLLTYDRGVAELHNKFGVAFPTDIQTRLGMVAVLATFLQKLPPTWFNEIAGGVRYAAPAQRKTAISYFAQIEPSLRTAIKQRLGDAEQDERAA